MRRLSGLVFLVLMFAALAAMRATTPAYVRITGPLDIDGAPSAAVHTGNLVVEAGTPRLASTLRFRANGKVETRDSGGMWLVIPVRSQAERMTARVQGAIWQTSDGRQYSASTRVAIADAVLSPIKTIQPGLQRRDLLVFELPAGAPPGGTLLLSEDRYPRLTAQARIPYPATPLPPPATTLDLDDMHARF
jgi:hypothetical protein